jgi:hypothetical protein
MRNIFCVITAIGLLLAAPVNVLATEGGGTSKALGVDTVFAGVMPPPGLNITNFTAFYTADRTLDSNGNDRANLENFDLFVFAEVMRFRYIFPNVTFLGANVEARVGVTLASYAEVEFDVRTPFGRIHREDSTTNIGDSLFGLILGWHGKKFHQMFGPELFIPTGKFSDDRLTNTSRGYLSVGPSYWFTWFPVEQLEISTAIIYLFNLENPDTNYLSGQELSIDYNVAYSIARDWQIGVSGYAYKQITDDEINDLRVGDGNRGQAVGFGPALRWHPHGKNFGITLKWQHEELIENRTKGERFFIQAMVQF